MPAGFLFLLPLMVSPPLVAGFFMRGRMGGMLYSCIGFIGTLGLLGLLLGFVDRNGSVLIGGCVLIASALIAAAIRGNRPR